MSVIIPVYNCEHYLWDTLGSVLAQDMDAAEMEIIAVDDGSTDASLTILESLAQRHDNLRVRSIPHSGSGGAPRNTGLDLATGRYVFFLDADDEIEPDALRRLVQVADDTGSGVVLCKVGPSGARPRATPIPTRAFRRSRFAADFIESMAYTTLAPWKLFRRSLIEDNHLRFPLGYRMGEDQPFVMGAFLKSPHVSILADKVYLWLQGRADGTNVTTLGQPPLGQLTKNVTLIRVVRELVEAGPRRDVLLHRPVMGISGLRTTFGPGFVDSMSRAEREEAVQEVRELLGPLWTPALRASGSVEPQVLVDLVLRGHVDDVEAASDTLSQGFPLPIDYDTETAGFVYRPASGEPVTGLAAQLSTHLDAVEPPPHDLTLRGSVGLVGGREAPKQVRLVWRHRGRGDEVSVPAETGEPYSDRCGGRVAFVAATELEVLKRRGRWDAQLEAEWPEVTLRARLAGGEAEPAVTGPMHLGGHPAAVLTLTRAGNVAVDVGRPHRH